MKKLISLGLAFLLAMGMATTILAADKTTSFSDVPEDHWAYSAIMDMTARGIFTGTTAPVDGVGTFSPDDTISLAAFITVLVRYLYPDQILPLQEGQEWWEPSLNAAKETHLLELPGAEEGIILIDLNDIERTMTREEMAYVLMIASIHNGDGRVQNFVPISRIADYDSIENIYRSGVQNCFSLGLLGGVDDKGTFLPKGTLSRAAAATVIYRLIDPSTRLDVDFSEAAPNDTTENGGIG